MISQVFCLDLFKFSSLLCIVLTKNPTRRGRGTYSLWKQLLLLLKGGTEKKIMFNGPKILKIFPKKRLMRKNGTHPIVLSLSLFFSI